MKVTTTDTPTQCRQGLVLYRRAVDIITSVKSTDDVISDVTPPILPGQVKRQMVDFPYEYFNAVTSVRRHFTSLLLFFDR